MATTSAKDLPKVWVPSVELNRSHLLTVPDSSAAIEAAANATRVVATAAMTKGAVAADGKADANATGAVASATMTKGAINADVKAHNEEVVASEAARKLAPMNAVRLIVDADILPRCLADNEGHQLGCASTCQCSWGQQCYPKKVAPVSQEADEREDIGICGLATGSLMALSSLLFIGTLTFVVAVRMYLQWCESCDPDYDRLPSSRPSQAILFLAKDASGSLQANPARLSAFSSARWPRTSGQMPGSARLGSAGDVTVSAALGPPKSPTPPVPPVPVPWPTEERRGSKSQ
jgi:hypothetical protein